jgi:uncharacterized protein (DUF4415 family)
MKRATTSKTFPSSKAERAALIAAAPDRVAYDPETDPYDPNDPKAVAAAMKKAVVVRGGGPEAVRAALAAKRYPGQRGPQKTPTKERVSLRLSREVLAHFRATGDGWQSRIDETLKGVLKRKQL